MDQDLLTPTARVPRFMQLTMLLQREIIGGQYLPGDRLPPESELANYLKVAVGTLRKQRRDKRLVSTGICASAYRCPLLIGMQRVL